MKTIQVKVYIVTYSSYSNGDNELFGDVLLTTTDKNEAIAAFNKAWKYELSEEGSLPNPTSVDKTSTHCTMFDDVYTYNFDIVEQEINIKTTEE